MNTTVVTEELGLGLAGKLFLENESLAVLNDVIVGQWINTACTVLIVYEWLITLDMEVQFIWGNNTTQKLKILTKVLYVVSRYGVVVDLMFNYLRDYSVKIGMCATVFQVSKAVALLGTSASEYILASRVCAVWKMNKAVILLLATIYIGKSVYALTNYRLTLHPTTFLTVSPLGGCLANTQGPTLWILYVLLSFYDTVMVTLMTYPTIKEYRFFGERTELMGRVFDEGVIFYVLLLLTDVVSVALQLTVRDNTLLLPIPARLSRSILATRTILHLREFSSRDVRLCTSTTAVMSNIRFRSGDECQESEVET